jgi:hypothetical protein
LESCESPTDIKCRFLPRSRSGMISRPGLNDMAKDRAKLSAIGCTNALGKMVEM